MQQRFIRRAPSPFQSRLIAVQQAKRRDPAALIDRKSPNICKSHYLIQFLAQLIPVIQFNFHYIPVDVFLILLTYRTCRPLCI